MQSEKLDTKGMRTHCPNCNRRLQRRTDWEKETCKGCRNKVSYNPILDLPYSDTNVPVEQSMKEIETYLKKMDLREVGWTTKIFDNITEAKILTAQFKDGTGFRVALPPIITSDKGMIEKQVMRIFFHYIKAISVIHGLEIMSKSELLLGLLKIGETNLGTLVGSDQMLETMNKATQFLQSGD